MSIADLRCCSTAFTVAGELVKMPRWTTSPTLGFMRMPPGNDLNQYGDAWHVRINQQWRLTFKWGDDGPYDVKIDDPH